MQSGLPCNPESYNIAFLFKFLNKNNNRKMNNEDDNEMDVLQADFTLIFYEYNNIVMVIHQSLPSTETWSHIFLYYYYYILLYIIFIIFYYILYVYIIII